jgi:hypothetical protein
VSSGSPLMYYYSNPFIYSGAGYQNSWGVANEVVSLIEQVVQNLSDGTQE